MKKVALSVFANDAGQLEVVSGHGDLTDFVDREGNLADPTELGLTVNRVPKLEDVALSQGAREGVRYCRK